MSEPTLAPEPRHINVKGRATCTRCGGRAVNNGKVILCHSCRTSCPECGARKRDCSQRCRRCEGLRKYAEHPEYLSLAQANSSRNRTGTGRKFHELTEAHFNNTMTSGRWASHYTDDGGRVRLIYRYQWRWIKANGPIPAGYHVHHKDENHTNDQLDNLELLTKSAHHSLHAAKHKKERWPCAWCGKMYRKVKGQKRTRFCSVPCYRAWLVSIRSDAKSPSTPAVSTAG